MRPRAQDQPGQPPPSEDDGKMRPRAQDQRPAGGRADRAPAQVPS
jgi:hypothetical protein